METLPPPLPSALLMQSYCHVESIANISSDYGNAPARSVPPGQFELHVMRLHAFPFACLHLYIVLISAAQEELSSVSL